MNEADRMFEFQVAKNVVFKCLESAVQLIGLRTNLGVADYIGSFLCGLVSIWHKCRRALQNHEFLVVCHVVGIWHCFQLPSWSVDSPGDRLDHRNFTCCTFMHICLWYVYMKY